MSARGGKSGGGSSSSNDKFEDSNGHGDKRSLEGQESSSSSHEHDQIKAILLADSFSKTFRPISLEKPKVLFPLVNVPMLEYSLEFLAQNKVEKVYVFSAWHHEQIEEYINKSKWLSILKIHIIATPNCNSSCGAIRELDKQGIIVNKHEPFVIMSGDVVTNIDLKKAIEFHKERARIDQDCVMTVIFKQLHKEAPIRRSDDDLRVGLDLNNSQVVLFDNDTFSTAKKVDSDNVKIPFHILKKHPKLCIRSDLLDCHIDICSPLLMNELGSDSNADYKDIRKDYIFNEVTREDFNKNIYGYIVQSGEYAARVHDPRTYHTISRDIINMWLSPFNPNSNIFMKSSYTHFGKYVYREKDVAVDRTAIIEESVVLGSNTKVGDQVPLIALEAARPAVLRRSVIGRNCKIANGAQISDSHIWDDVIVEEDAVIDHAIICNGAVIKKGAVVPRGAIISFGVVVYPNNLPKFSRVSNFQKPKDEIRDGGCGEEDDNVSEDSAEDDEFDDDCLGDPDYESKSNNDSRLREGFTDEKVRIWKTLSNESRASIGGLLKSELLTKKISRKTVNPVIPTGKRSLKIAGFSHLVNYLDSIYVIRNNADIAQISKLTKEITTFRLSNNKTNNDCLEVIVPYILTKLKTEIQTELENQPGSRPVDHFMKLIPPMIGKRGCWGYELLVSNIYETSNCMKIITCLEDFCVMPDNKDFKLGTLLSRFYGATVNLEEINVKVLEAVKEWVQARCELVPSDPRSILFKSENVQIFAAKYIEKKKVVKKEDSDSDSSSSSSSSSSDSDSSSDSSSSSSSSSGSDSSDSDSDSSSSESGD